MHMFYGWVPYLHHIFIRHAHRLAWWWDPHIKPSCMSSHCPHSHPNKKILIFKFDAELNVCICAVLEMFIFMITFSLQNVLHLIFLSDTSHNCKINGKILDRFCPFSTWQRNFFLTAIMELFSQPRNQFITLYTLVHIIVQDCHSCLSNNQWPVTQSSLYILWRIITLHFMYIIWIYFCV